MTGCSFGDVLLVPFPFTDQSRSRKRPADVVSSARYQRERPDLILMPITGQNSGSTRLGDVPVSDINATGLLMPAVIKPVMFTIEAKLVIESLGRLVDDDQRALRHAVSQLIGRPIKQRPRGRALPSQSVLASTNQLGDEFQRQQVTKQCALQWLSVALERFPVTRH